MISHYPPIRVEKYPDWDEISSVPVQDYGEPLVRVPPQSNLKLLPVYAQAGIAGAISELILRQNVSERLLHAASNLPNNIGLVVFDGWRPTQVQRTLRENMRQQIISRHPDADETWIKTRLDEFVADPDRRGMCAPHLTGGSVDVGLFNQSSGQLLDMGTQFDETGHLSYTAALEQEHDDHFTAARQYRRILYAAMYQAGFTNLPTEWWHFDFGNNNWAYFSHQKQALYGAAEWRAHT